ncbi:unnamed protein product [Closterium sp. Yama58-4]|nr:unnamed protein product [Closterium sp. Yama58-4]
MWIERAHNSQVDKWISQVEANSTPPRNAGHKKTRSEVPAFLPRGSSSPGGAGSLRRLQSSPPISPDTMAAALSWSTKLACPSFEGLSSRSLPSSRVNADSNVELKTKGAEGAPRTTCSLKAMRDRIESVKNTQKITDAMKLVAAAKVRRAQEAVVNGRPFSENLVKVLYNVNEQLQNEDVDIPLTEVRPVKKVAIVVNTGDRGLCGGFNNYVLKKAESRVAELEKLGVAYTIVSIGKKGNAFFKRRPQYAVDRYLEVGAAPTTKEAQAIADEIFSLFVSEEVDKVELIYTKFVSLIKSDPVVHTLLPLSPAGEVCDINGVCVDAAEDELFRLTTKEGKFAVERETIRTETPEFTGVLGFEQEPVQILDALLPLYLNSQILRALQESLASELAARMNAMGNASDNAKELKRSLNLTYNRRRQAKITGELIEIVSVTPIMPVHFLSPSLRLATVPNAVSTLPSPSVSASHAIARLSNPAFLLPRMIPAQSLRTGSPQKLVFRQTRALPRASASAEPPKAPAGGSAESASAGAGAEANKPAEAPQPPAGGAVAAEGDEGGLLGKATTAGIFLLWAGLIAYGAFLAPHQTPYRDQYFLEKLLNLRGDDGFVMNQVLVTLWNLMGVMPGIYAATLVPASRTLPPPSNRTTIPAWPFLLASFFAGAFALMPFFALWTPGKAAVPTEEERGKVGLRVLESKITSALLLLAASGLVISAATAPSADWLEFLQYFQESLMIHVTSMDFVLVNMFLPFWLFNDMAYRNWAPRDSWGVALPFIPVIGPALYLVVRPGLPPPPPAAAESKSD